MADYTVKYRIGVDTGNAAENLDRVSRSGEKADKAVKQISNTAGGSATYAMTNFNRVVQDAPFGFLGIANNIDPLMTSFQKLKAETGSGTAAFKALVGTLSGPMGMLFAVNLLVMAIQVLPGLFSKISASVSGTSSKIRELTDATKAQSIFTNEAIVKNLGQAKAVERLGAELLKTNAGSQRRHEILSQLKAINPEVLKGIDAHTTSEKKLKEAVQKATSTIWDKIEAQLTDIFLAPSYAKLAEGYSKYAAAFQKQTENTKKAWDKDNPTTDEQFRQANREMDQAKLQLTKVTTEFNKDLSLASSTVRNLVIALGGTLGNNDTTDPKLSGGKVNDTSVSIIRPVQSTVEQFIEQALEEWRDGWLKRGEGEDLLNAAVPGQKLGILVALEAVEAKGYDIEKMMGRLNLSFDEFTGFSVKIERGFDSAFDNLSTSLADAIWGYERLDLVGQKFLNTLAQMVIQTIILSAIQAGIGALFGPIGMSGWIQKNIFGVDAVGGRSLTGGIGISTGEINLLRNISRQTLNLGGEIKLRATGNDLKGVLKAEDLFRGSNR